MAESAGANGRVGSAKVDTHEIGANAHSRCRHPSRPGHSHRALTGWYQDSLAIGCTGRAQYLFADDSGDGTPPTPQLGPARPGFSRRDAALVCGLGTAI